MLKVSEGKLHKHFQQGMKGVCVWRLETRIGLGVPDCLVAIQNRRWVLLELKVISRGKKIRLSPHQIAFGIKAAALGVPSFILVLHCPTKGDGELLLYKGAQAVELFSTGIDTPPLDRWSWLHVEWGALAKLLASA